MPSSRIPEIFARLRAEGRTTLIPFITAGYPSLEVTAQAIGELAAAGCPLIELGIPFSDPIADGPVIAASMHAALRSGVSPATVFETVRRVRREGVDSPPALVAMVSHSIVARMGPERFITDAAEAGFDGLIVPDLDTAAAMPVAGLAAVAGLSFSVLIAPTTPPRRIELLVGLCSGFVYLLARTGITGERDAAPDVADRVAAIRTLTDLPVAVGFGISRPEHVEAVTGCADAAIVGSALVRRMGEADNPVSAAGALARRLVASLSPASTGAPRSS